MYSNVEKYKPVTREEFFNRVNPLDVILDTQREITYWKLRHGPLIGITEGYMPGKKFYALVK